MVKTRLLNSSGNSVLAPWDAKPRNLEARMANSLWVHSQYHFIREVTTLSGGTPSWRDQDAKTEGEAMLDCTSLEMRREISSGCT